MPSQYTTTKWVEWTYIAWVSFYFIWMLYTLLIVPGTGDWLYFGLCLFAGLTMVASGFAMSDHIPSTHSPQKPKLFDRRSALQKSGGSHTDQEWRDLCDAFKGRCAKCKKRASLTKDHIVSVYSGGTDNIDNLQPLCQPCNSSKGTRTIDYRAICHCKYCNVECRNKSAEYSHYRTCPRHPKNVKE